MKVRVPQPERRRGVRRMYSRNATRRRAVILTVAGPFLSRAGSRHVVNGPSHAMSSPVGRVASIVGPGAGAVRRPGSLASIHFLGRLRLG